MIMHPEKEFNPELSLSNYVQSDHLAILMNINFETIENLRTPMINKERVLKKVKNLRSYELNLSRMNPMHKFL